MANKLEKASKLVYDYEIEVLYWNSYYTNLLHFLGSNKGLNEVKANRIIDELIRVEKYKSFLAQKIVQKIYKHEAWETDKKVKEHLNKLKIES